MNRHKYAPISGGVEVSDTSPLATAWRELEEETTLTASSLRLLRQGKPYSFTDPQVGRIWTINPFAFILKPGVGEESITIDWEHEGYKWFDPGEVTDDESFHGVPRLKESLRRVWFDIDLGRDAGGVLAAGLKTLQEDHESGARQLASAALDMYLDVIPRIDTSDGDTWWKNIRFAAWHLWKNGRESMGAPILSVVLSSLSLIEHHLTQTCLSKDLVDEICADIKHLAQQRHQSATKIATAFVSFLNKTFPSQPTKPLKIVTLSSSSTITASISLILESASRPLDIHVLESRPLFEGVTAARRFSSLIQTNHNENKSSVTIHTDASAALASKDAHILLLGADLIDKAGNVSNKTGSLPAVLAAKHVCPEIKVVVLSEKEKVLPFDPPGHEENDGEELIRGWDGILGPDVGLQGLSVTNVYFEWVPARLVDVYLTEDGAEGTQHVEAWAQEVRQKAGRFFDHL
ncbi:uncharacterized protein Triagg1_8958 [Trichoderma aggressivum f. europaeum]|uniref:Nudix hydrolase domain-containing protein n=1 Tax=Trichoderma aggressivum f. europaeum TaxID=173218 RepID=A0AAE1I9K8_9HYPO|nr:hypothetical protein Triagg1_8958 [Trichoderma aggressivum f. europaeum]